MLKSVKLLGFIPIDRGLKSDLSYIVDAGNGFLPSIHIDKTHPSYYHLPKMLNIRPTIIILILTIIMLFIFSQFMLIRVQEDSMNPTLFDGQWVIVLRGSRRIRPGDIAVYINPLDHELVVKRYILSSDSNPVIDHGWLVTSWGRWYLSEEQWNRMDNERSLPKGLFFMVGDNQFQSFDSRNYGFIPRESLVGRVVLRRKHD